MGWSTLSGKTMKKLRTGKGAGIIQESQGYEMDKPTQLPPRPYN